MPLPDTLCPGLLALELLPEGAPRQLTLPVESAAALAEVIAEDLARLLPGVAELGLAIAAALYDSAQVLRPGWPLFAALARLHARAPGASDGPTISCFGAAAGRMADAVLEPEAGLIGSPLLLLPWTLIGSADQASAVGAEMEARFTETGLAAARTALFLNEAFSIHIEQARFLTHLDLCALASMQYQHADLAGLWALVECALLSPQADESCSSPAGDIYRWQGGVLGRQSGPASAESLAAAEERRRYRAILAAHGLPLRESP